MLFHFAPSDLFDIRKKKPEYKSKKLDSYVDVKLFYILLEKTTLKCDDKSRKQQGFAYT